MAMYMKGEEGFVSSELEEAGSEGDDGTRKSSVNAFWSLSGIRVDVIWEEPELAYQEKESVSESEQGTTYSILSYTRIIFSLQWKLKMDMPTVSFFFPLMAQRVQLSRFRTSTSVHCCTETMFFYGYPSGWERNTAYRRRYHCRPERDLMQIEDILPEKLIERDTVIVR